MGQRRRRSGVVQPAVCRPAAILAPSHLGGVEAEVLAADVVMLADLSAAQAGEEAFRLIGARAILGEGNRVVNAMHLKPGV